jgi:hypothetical protein
LIWLPEESSDAIDGNAEDYEDPEAAVAAGKNKDHVEERRNLKGQIHDSPPSYG